MSASKGLQWHSELDLDKIHLLDACRGGDVTSVREILGGGDGGRLSLVDVDECDDDYVTGLQIGL